VPTYLARKMPLAEAAPRRGREDLGGKMMARNGKLPDLAARTSALTAVDRSLLVEARAGSGKTSIMAGRVAVLFARRVAPKHVAAITFTEFAASELMIRIERFVTGLARGRGSARPRARVFVRGVRRTEDQPRMGEEEARPAHLHDDPRLRPS
jgi:UvrD/REP helicase N-terminal domain